jgi:hypothetical protein
MVASISSPATVITPPATMITPIPARHARRRIGFIRERLRDLQAEKIRLNEELKALKDQIGIKTVK